MNRSIAPNIQPITSVNLLDAEQVQIGKHTTLYLLPGGDQDVVSLQFVFPAGRWQEELPLQSLLTASLLTEGTKSKSSKEVNEQIDFHGAHVKVSSSYDFTTLQLVCLTKHLPNLLTLLVEVLNEPSFSEAELDIKRNHFIEKYKINLQKTDYLAQRIFHEKVFGAEHPYGYFSSVEKYKAISSQDLQQFYAKQYSLKNGFVLLAGNFSGDVLTSIISAIEQIEENASTLTKKTHQLATQPGKYHQRKPKAQQASIRIGFPTITITHPDFQALHLLNTVLGGYFGSRLMSNLREDKGYTYGAYSFLGSFLQEGYCYIGTDVGSEQAEAAVTEIYAELKRLQTEAIPEAELQLVKNYVMGKYLAKIDGPFAQAKVFRSLLLRGETAEDFVDRVSRIQQINSSQLQALAQQYFSTEQMIEVVV